jgi:hypothetical protein
MIFLGRLHESSRRNDGAIQRWEKLSMLNFKVLSAGLMLVAIFTTGVAQANVFVCRPQCTDTHQSCAGRCDDKKCVARCTDTMNACLKSCDQAGKTR